MFHRDTHTNTNRNGLKLNKPTTSAGTIQQSGLELISIKKS